MPPRIIGRKASLWARRLLGPSRDPRSVQTFERRRS